MELIEAYTKAINTGDVGGLRSVFHEKAQIVGRFEGKLEWVGLDAFIQTAVETAPTEDLPPQPYDIHGIEISGDTAIARVAILWGTLNFFDTLSLVRDEGRWRIVTRLFTFLG